MKKWIIIGVIAFSGFLTLLFATVFIWELIETRLAWNRFPPPGKMVKLKDGRRIQLDCRGTGSPVVVFESGGDTFGSLSWASVHDSISNITRACTYSRSGIMWSDDRNDRATGQNIARDLRELLQVAEEKPPYILVGHSMGGPLVTIFTKYFGDDVSGLVFVDASHPDQFNRIRKEIPSFPDAKMSNFKKFIMKLVARFGILRAGLTFQGGHGLENQPVETKEPAIAYASRSSGYVKEMEMLEKYLQEANAFHDFKNRPLYVLTAMRPLTDYELMIMGGISIEDGKHSKLIWRELQDEEATWSSNSRHEILNDSGHYIQFDRPDAVIASIKEVIESVRTNKKL